MVFTGGSTNPVETFSSDGPRRIFFDANGNPITPANFSSTGGTVRQKPDIAAADCVATATPYFNPFCGTSVAAPHAIAIAALLLQTNPSLTTSQIRSIFNLTALDIEAVGIDRNSGAGVVMADSALAILYQQPRVINVPSGDTRRLIDAINVANAAITTGQTTINLETGTYSLSVSNDSAGEHGPDGGPNGLPQISSSIKIVGKGADKTIITRQNDAKPFRIFYVTQTGKLDIDSLTISNGSLPLSALYITFDGGALFNNGNVNITNSIIRNNLAYSSAGISNSYLSNINLSNTTLSDNIAERGTGGISNSGQAILLDFGHPGWC